MFHCAVALPLSIDQSLRYAFANQLFLILQGRVHPRVHDQCVLRQASMVYLSKLESVS